MKYFKYILFLVFIYFCVLLGVSADVDYSDYEKACVYKDDNVYFVAGLKKKIENGKEVQYYTYEYGSYNSNYTFSYTLNSLVYNVDDFLGYKEFACPRKINRCDDVTLSPAVKVLGFSNICHQSDIKMEAVDAKNTYIFDGADDIRDNELDLENPCTGAFLGVFTTIGYIFYIIKIIIPLMLIIFGAIDLSKAVLNSKPHDEITKSTKSLILRAVAGIIIFFVPTFLNFLIGFLQEDDSKFARCTDCIKNPNRVYCIGLEGDYE